MNLDRFYFGMSDSTNTNTNGGENGNSNNNNNNTTSSPRWRFDIDLNFDPPSWLRVGQNTGRQITPTAITMLNDWMRTPYSFRQDSTTDTNNGNNRGTGANLNNTQHNTVLNLGRIPSSSRSRGHHHPSMFPASSNIEVSSSNNSSAVDGVESNLPLPTHHSQTSGSRSRPYQNIDIDNNSTHTQG